ncbi:MAG: type IV-A pilus assembly ATPase PilB, partial [Proteobacteria bacterium]|nr:type IV-A pilus assembly ATPase PilB [Pseudomonadota bacterium]
MNPSAIDNLKRPSSLGLTGRLIADQLITVDEAAESQKQSALRNMPLVQYLVDVVGVDSRQLAHSLASEFGAPLLDLSAYNPDYLPKDLVDLKLLQKHRALPLFKRGKRLFIALADPTRIEALDEIKFHTGITTEVIVADHTLLSSAIEKFADAKTSIEQLGELNHESYDDLDINTLDEPDGDDAGVSKEVDDTPIVRFVNKVLIDAIKAGASDIHFEPYEHHY